MHNLFEKLFVGKVGNILLLGILLIIFSVVAIIVSYQIDASFTNKITGMVFTNIFVGRVPSLSLGYASELNSFWVISTNVLVELILVFILYPLFVLSFKGMLQIEMLENFFNEVQRKKEQHQKTFNKYGRFGLFIFVFIPFWMTGPIVGAMIGFLIGLKHYSIMAIVFVATVISISLWAIFLQEIVDIFLLFNVELLWFILISIIVIVVIWRFKNIIYDKMQKIFRKKNS